MGVPGEFDSDTNQNEQQEVGHENDRRFLNDNSDTVRYLSVQNHLLMQRLTALETDFAALKQDHISLKATVESNSAETRASESEITTLDKVATNKMMSIDMMSLTPTGKLPSNSNLVGDANMRA